MIGIGLILGAVALVGIASAFWNDIVNWMKKAINKIKTIITGILRGSKIFIQKIAEGIKEISYYYSQVEDHWEENIVTKIVSADKVPEDIRRKALYGQETDITEELELELRSA